MNQAATSRTAPRFAKFLAVLIALANIGAYLFNYSRKGIFWDLQVYLRAVNDNLDGLNPYRTDVQYAFVYHPAVLDFLTWVGKDHLLACAQTAYALIVIAFVYFYLRKCGAAKKINLLFAMSLGGIGIFSIASGNVTTFLHLALITSILHAQRTGAEPEQRFSSSFYATLAIAAVIKPYFLLYLALPILSNRKCLEYIYKQAACVAAFAVVWLTYKILAPWETADFLHALNAQTNGKGDLGYAFFGLIKSFGFSTITAGASHIALLVTMGTLVFKKTSPDRGADFISGLQNAAIWYFILTLANPRMKEYDLFPAIAFITAHTFRKESQYDWILASTLLIASTPLPFKIIFSGRVDPFSLFMTNAATWQALALSFFFTARVLRALVSSPARKTTHRF
jgi:hypothetical protein